ncbi:MAG TPA: dihydroorotate dehydrogenase electron transfer subunit [Phycisphaerae bacterium]|nr:dihydroorotate dehydrogenase electron transfer subunit [Phycisphaerae bacterium]HRY71012.1 dihydroorotate dehydrogenase electron transfer subunit [Phycisphaerae bacterium]HSA29304.1 dihydroorotate dehydrogenase electron transfer subunit [Phycisphaerae bacterium]
MATPAADEQARKGVFEARVLSSCPICREHFRLRLGVDDFPQAEPGQFVQILCSAPDGGGCSGGPLLRRPFSIGGMRRNGRQIELEIVYRVVGAGTRWLSNLSEGNRVSVLGPQGRPFMLDSDRPLALLVGGGVGLPPIVWLAESVARTGGQAVAFCGARSADLLPLAVHPSVVAADGEPSLSIEEFARHGIAACLTTDDGTLGLGGRIPEALERYLDSHRGAASRAAAYTCGPEPMIRAVARACESRGIPCQVCLERLMACGMGTCQSCVIRTHDADDPEGWVYRLCCTDGPVFDSRQVVWASA